GPDAPVVAAVVGPTGDRPVLVDRAAAAPALEVAAVAVRPAADQIRMGQVPPDDTLLEVLPGEGEAQPTAGRLAEVDAVLTVDPHAVLESVLVDLRLLQHYAHAVVFEPLHQPLGDLPLALVQLLFGQ